MSTYIENKTVRKVDYTTQELASEYEKCEFFECDFSQVNLSNIIFSECVFKDCNLSTVILKHTSLKDIKFESCKMLGVSFSDCNPFLLSFDFLDCQLDFASFYKLPLKKKKISHCSFREADFSQADFTGSIFENCDFLQANFDNTILEKVDFRTSRNYSINPERNKIKQAKFAIPGVLGLLDKYNIEIE